MDEHTGFISRFNAWLMQKGSACYNKRVDERKRNMFSELSGKVLEIGPGTGANLEYYPDEVSLTGLEPNPYMHKYLIQKSRETGKQINIISGNAEKIPKDADYFNYVVSTLVLCSVDNMDKSLSEIKRVLQPGGEFLFIEHVAAPENSYLRGVQELINPIWKRIADGCHPDRETWKSIKNTGFHQVEIHHFHLSLMVVGPHIMGKAKKKGS